MPVWTVTDSDTAAQWRTLSRYLPPDASPAENVVTCSTADCNVPVPASTACAPSPAPPPLGSCPVATVTSCLAGYSGPAAFLSFLSADGQGGGAALTSPPAPVALPYSHRYVCATLGYSCEAAMALRTSYTLANGTAVVATAADCPRGQSVRSYVFFPLADCSSTLNSLRATAYFESLLICGASNCTSPEMIPPPPPSPQPPGSQGNGAAGARRLGAPVLGFAAAASSLLLPLVAAAVEAHAAAAF